MDEKNFAEVLIDGKVYTLGGSEDAQYLQSVASYINDKITQLKRQEGFTKQSIEYQSVMAELNIADDYFKAVERAEASEKRAEETEKDAYSLKHDLVTLQMKLDSKDKELKETAEKLSKVQDELRNLQSVQFLSGQGRGQGNRQYNNNNNNSGNNNNGNRK